MKEEQAREKLTIIETIKENAVSFITIGSLVWIVFSYVILPIQKLQFQITNILDNHLATIQTEMTKATAERDAQTDQLNALSEQMIRLSTQLELKK